MSPKSLVLIAAAALVLGMGLYLFIQVKSTPAEAQAPAVGGAGVTHAPAPSTSTSTSTTQSPTPSSVQTTAARPSPAQVSASPELSGAPTPDEARPNIKVDSMMELANKAYDAQDFDQAIAIAGKVLAKDPSNTRMMRIMVSANCIAGDATVAQTWYEKLPQGIDRQQMKMRCERYQVSLKD